MKIEKTYILILLMLTMVLTVHAQEPTIVEDGIILEQNSAARSDVSLVQFGNQNVADLIQFDSFTAQLSLTQKGNYNEAILLQYGSGSIQVMQKGNFNHVAGLQIGDSMDLSIGQYGEGNNVNHAVLGYNSSYQFVQLGNENTINHLNFRGNDTGLRIQQRGSNMDISIIIR